jgi:phosphatidylglycerophosphatase A
VAVLYFFFPPSTVMQMVLLLVVTLIGTITSTVAEKELGLDAGPIVIDEVAGMIVTLLYVPMPATPLERAAVIFTALAFFRFFDIFKPWPADKLQHLPGGRGIMADDLMAGVYSNLALRIALALGLLRWVGGIGS